MYQAKAHIESLRLSRLALLVLLAFCLAPGLRGMPPHPDARNDIAASRTVEQQYLEELRLMRNMGLNAPDDVLQRMKTKASAPAAALAVTNFKTLVLLVDFSDNAHQVQAAFFDTLMFETDGISVHDYYEEVSNGQLNLSTDHPVSGTGWFRAPETYAYYVDGQRGIFGDYPHNTQKLIEDLVDAADPYVDFSQYDNDGDGYVDALVVVHSGRGYEKSLDVNDIHSHKWSIAARQKDGVYISSYTIQPEYMNTPGDQTIGVYCHELGHIFGLPDLYDTDYTSRGVGRWCLMSYGSWNGPSQNGGSPAHLSAWCRKRLGWSEVINVAGNTNGQEISPVETGGPVLRVWNAGNTSSAEHFLLENRQQTGYDTYLPSSGLLIWHIDDTRFNYGDNADEWWPGLTGDNHFLVALEQADGRFDLEHNANNGDDGDPFPGSTANNAFNLQSLPNTSAYTSGSTSVAIENLLVEGDMITADLTVGLASDFPDPLDGLLPNRVELSQNYPNPFNPTTTIRFSVSCACWVTLEVFNITGQRVKSLMSGPVEPGMVTVNWDGTDDSGQAAASGIYLYRLTADAHHEVRKMVLLR